MDFEFALMVRDMAEAAERSAVSLLTACNPNNERASMGLTPDHIQALPAWKRARTLHAVAFENLRQANTALLKGFPKEYR